MDIELVTDKICMMYIVSPLAGHIVAASSLQLVISGKADISAARVPSSAVSYYYAPPLIGVGIIKR